MSLSKVSLLCVFCEEDRASYKCPRCNVKYCSSKCFKDPRHNRCSESFYQDWILNTLHTLKSSESDKGKMVNILKKVAIENEDVCDDNEAASLESRIADIDLSKDIDEKELWGRLTEEEQKSFKEMLSNENDIADVIPVIQPWWVANKITFVKKEDEEFSEKVAVRPPLPIGIKRLSELTTKPASITIKYNIINILFGYTCLTRLYNNELRDFIEDVVDSVFILAPVFSENKNYSSLNEVVQDSMRLITTLRFQLSISFAKSLTYDICCILNGPKNAHSYYYIICALSDIKSLLLEFKAAFKKSECLKNIKQLLLQTVRKLDYLISWCVEYLETDLIPLSKEIEAKYFPEIITDIIHESEDKAHESKNDAHDEPKILIEELS